MRFLALSMTNVKVERILNHTLEVCNQLSIFDDLADWSGIAKEHYSVRFYTIDGQ